MGLDQVLDEQHMIVNVKWRLICEEITLNYWSQGTGFGNLMGLDQIQATNHKFRM